VPAFRFSPDAARSENMRRIRGKDTKPELVVRKMCRELGEPGYRLHRADLPGKPDVAYVGRKLAILVHGCFWHRHDCPVGLRIPKTNQAEYWGPKISRNVARDAASLEALREQGWRVLVLWECEIKRDEPKVRRRLARFLGRQPSKP
jgi:DNA mismatch endonuclease, patch repair protein